MVGIREITKHTSVFFVLGCTSEREFDGKKYGRFREYQFVLPSNHGKSGCFSRPGFLYENHQRITSLPTDK